MSINQNRSLFKSRQEKKSLLGMSLKKQIMEIMADTIPRTPHDVCNILHNHGKSVAVSMARLSYEGYLLVSDKKITVIRRNKGNNPSQRWKVHTSRVYCNCQPGETKFYQALNERKSRIDKIELQFDIVKPKKKPKRPRKQIIQELMKEQMKKFLSREDKGALYSSEIAEMLGTRASKISSDLSKLERKGILIRRGMRIFLGMNRKETPFREGYLWSYVPKDRFKNLAEAVQKANDACDDRLNIGATKELASNVYQRLIQNSQAGRFTARDELIQIYNLPEHRIDLAVEKANKIWQGVEYHKAGSYTFYYIPKSMTKKQIEREKRRLEKWIKKIGSDSWKKGAAFEEYGKQIFLSAYKAGHLTFIIKDVIPNYKDVLFHWKRNKGEFDLVIQFYIPAPLALDGYLVFEHRHSPVDKRQVDDFYGKLAHSKTFGSPGIVISETGDPIYGRAIKRNVTPVVVTSTMKRDEIVKIRTAEGRMIELSIWSYVRSLGGHIILRSSLDKWVRETFGVNISFFKLWSAGYDKEKIRQFFEKNILPKIAERELPEVKPEIRVITREKEKKEELFPFMKARSLKLNNLRGISFPVYVEPKIDGEFHFAHFNGNWQLYSKNLKDNTIAAITKRLPMLKGETVLIGELHAVDGGVDKVLVYQSSPEMYDKLRFAVFDVIKFNRKDLKDKPFEKRREIIEKILPSKGVVYKVNSEKVKGPGKVAKLFDKYVSKGYEGIVIKKANGIYQAGRPKSWIKIKKLPTFDGVIIGRKANKQSFVVGFMDDAGNIVKKVGISRIPSVTFGELLEKLKVIRKGNGYVYYKPEIVVEIQAQIRETKKGMSLFSITFVRVRDDKKPVPSDVNFNQILDAI